ncbi:MAG TPA: AraC family transcriptional regulator ligand-binding domain-containing protein, partial [Cyclobacteriaceae bacterium]|nr:AraC family transcriptional regulator ligand-binding domain-containing protein [Cyclobacteriaceae bacterium]
MEEHSKQFVMSMLGYAAQRDISIEKLCKLTGIDLRALKEGTHPAITQHQLNNLWINASHLANDPLFGLHFGESLQLAALGIVGEIIKSSATVGEALTQAASLIHLFTDSFRLEIAQGKKSFIIHLKITKENEQGTFPFLQMRDLMLVFLIHELDGLLLEKIKPEKVKVSFDSRNAAEYERVLRCKPVNKNDECSFEFKMSYWNERIITANYELQKLL